MIFAPSPRAQEYRARVRAFVRERILPLELEHRRALERSHHGGDWTLWSDSPPIEALKVEARRQGLWNLFLPDPRHGAGLSTLEYAPIAEEMGWSLLAPEIFNCNAPDSGNMELLAKYGSEEQRERWLEPLLEGRMRSAFCMTEPEVASSDPTNLRATARIEGDAVILDGRKWWATGLGHPRCELLVFMGRWEGDGADSAALSRHQRHSMVLVPRDTPGVTIERMLPLFGDYDEPYGHGEVRFDGVRVPVSNLVAGPGRGFEIAQARLGPGRIHHCMRCLGAAERSLELLVLRGLARSAFGRTLLELGGNRERLAELRMAIDQARLLVLQAAWKLDREGAMASLAEISAIKVVAPNVLERVVDEAIQMHGGAGVASDLPLTGFYAQARALRIADGPDAVHRAVVARAEIAKHRSAREERAESAE